HRSSRRVARRCGRTSWTSCARSTSASPDPPGHRPCSSGSRPPTSRRSPSRRQAEGLTRCAGRCRSSAPAPREPPTAGGLGAGRPLGHHGQMSALVPHTVPAPLRPLVSSAVGYRVPAYPAGVHRGLPSRHLTLVIELLAPLGVTGMERPVSAHGVVGGLHTSAALIDATRPQEGLQYGLTPLGARVLLGVPAGELRGRAVDLGDVVGHLALRLVDRLATASGWDERFGLLDAALLRRAADWDGHLGRASIAPEVAEAWRLILTGDGTLPIATVAAHVGWG